MKKIIVAITVALAGLTAPLFATHGINLVGIGPVQQGTAGAGVASAKDSTWWIVNPAGLTDVDRSVDASFQVFAPVRTIDSTLSPAGKQKDDSIFVIPAISASLGCCQGERGSFGFGLYGTSGMGVDYDQPRISTPGGNDQMTELSVAKMTATYAYKFGDSGLSIGAGPILVVSQFRTDMMGPTGLSSGNSEMATGVGGIIGINQKLGRFVIGGSYMTEQFMSSYEEYDNLFNKSLNLPQQLTLGVAYSVVDNVELALDYQWLGWSELKVMGDQFGWDDQNIIKAGVTWGVTEALTLRTGLSYGKSPIDSKVAFNNSLFPAITETHWACGASYAWEKWAVHGSYIHAFKNSLTDTSAPVGPGSPGGTKISMYQNSLTLGVSRAF